MNKSTKINVNKKKSVWHRELYWCPSQLWKDVTHGKEKYRLYARWRHRDPWEGYLVALDNSGENGKWSNEVLRKYNYTEQTKVEEIELTLEQTFEEYVVKRTKTIDWNEG